MSQNSMESAAPEQVSSQPFSKQPIPNLFKDAYPFGKPASPEASSPKIENSGNAAPVNTRIELPGEAKLSTGTPVERLNAFVDNNFDEIDANSDGRFNEAELKEARSRMLDKNELHQLDWMTKNMNILEYLGDGVEGISRQDLSVFTDASNNGTGDLSFALRRHNFLFSAAVSAGGAGIYGWLTKASSPVKLGLATVGIVGSAAITAGNYYLTERSQLDEAINELVVPPKLPGRP